MCRFVLYLGPPITLSTLITEPENSIIHQSYRSQRHVEPLNGDGFGVAWYVPELAEEPAIFRSVTPAWNNQNLIQLARVTRSPCFLAHVRAATRGLPVTETNCHPFTWGPFAFMHNGDVGGFQQLRRAMLESLSQESFNKIEGSTDSEHLFALFLDRVRNFDGRRGSGSLADALRLTIEGLMEFIKRYEISEPSYLNIAVTDGRSAVACRYTTDKPEQALTLYLHTGKRYVCEDGVCRMVDPEKGHETVLICSEPLSEDPGWTPVPPNHLVLVKEDRAVQVFPC